MIRYVEVCYESSKIIGGLSPLVETCDIRVKIEHSIDKPQIGAQRIIPLTHSIKPFSPCLLPLHSLQSANHVLNSAAIICYNRNGIIATLEIGDGAVNVRHN